MRKISRDILEMKMFSKQSVNRPSGLITAVLAASIMAGLALPLRVQAQKSYDPGASDTELKIGNIMSYSGWAQAYGAIGRAEAAYFRMINDRGGVNGRKISFISVDNGSTANLSVSGLGDLNGTTTNFNSPGSVTFTNGTDLTVSGATTIQSPSIITGAVATTHIAIEPKIPLRMMRGLRRRRNLTR